MIYNYDVKLAVVRKMLARGEFTALLEAVLYSDAYEVVAEALERGENFDPIVHTGEIV